MALLNCSLLWVALQPTGSCMIGSMFSCSWQSSSMTSSTCKSVALQMKALTRSLPLLLVRMVGKPARQAVTSNFASRDQMDR